MENPIIPEDLFKFILDNILLQLNIEEPIEPADDASEKEKAKYLEEMAKYNNLIDLFILYINKTCQEIIIRTNRNKFPEDLKYLVIDTVINIYENNTTNINSEDNQAIQSMSETGRSVSFGISEAMKIKYNLFIQEQLNNSNTLINRYRLLYKVRCPIDEKN